MGQTTENAPGRNTKMSSSARNTNLTLAAVSIFGLIYHNTVRSVRKTHRDALAAIAINVLQMLIMVVVFYLLFDLLGMRSMAIKGDFLLYVMSGIFVFMTHVKAMGAVNGAETSASPMMQHLPMTPFVSVTSAAFGALYIQVLAMLVIMIGYHLIWTPIAIDKPFGAAMMLLLAWISGAATGLIFLAVKPWLPQVAATGTQLYTRINMFASGKMFVANQLTASMVAMFYWNPLFHIIDQGRGYTFINYFPHKTSLTYPIIVTAILLVIGCIGVSYSNRHESLSWGAAR